MRERVRESERVRERGSEGERRWMEIGADVEEQIYIKRKRKNEKERGKERQRYIERGGRER